MATADFRRLGESTQPLTRLWDATMELKDTLGERLNHPAVTRT